jgi:protein-tyrosine phosphatase
MTTTTKRFDKLYNFRDIGGLKTTDGRYMKSDILYRSDELSRLTKKDLATLQSHNLKLIIDLRTENEKKSKPDRVPLSQDLQQVHIPIYHDSQDFSKVEFFKLLTGNSKDLDFEVLIKEFYQSMATERLTEINQALTLISQSSNVPALIHCTGGKDRTGLLSALIQLTCGVPFETVMNEYLRSNDLIEPRMKKIERFIRLMSLFQIPRERIKPLLIVKADYLLDTHDYMLNQFGSVEGFLIEGCKVEERTLHGIRELLLD